MFDFFWIGVFNVRFFFDFLFFVEDFFLKLGEESFLGVFSIGVRSIEYRYF